MMTLSTLHKNSARILEVKVQREWFIGWISVLQFAGRGRRDTGVLSYWDRDGAPTFWFNAFELLFSERDISHTLGENIEKWLTEVDLRSGRRGKKKYIFSVVLPTLCLHGDGLEGEGYVSG